MREFIVILKDGAEIELSAFTHEGAVQEAKERGYQPSHAELAPVSFDLLDPTTHHVAFKS